MQQMTLFVRILPSLYRLGSEAVYAYLPEGGADSVWKSNAVEIEAIDIFNHGGTFIYLRYPIEEHQNLLIPFVEMQSNFCSIMFLDNDGDYLRHWKMRGWNLREHKMQRIGVLDIYGFRIVISGGSEVEAGQEGIYFKNVRFGKNEMEECKEAFFSWNGHFRFMVYAGKIFWQEAQIRYELDGYDALTQRYLSIVCNTGEPQWTGKDEIWAQADIFWDISKETAFVFPDDTVIHIMGFPAIRMGTLAFRFAKGTEEYYLAAFGRGDFLDSGDVVMGAKGVFRVKQGDGVEILIVPEGYLGKSGLCAEVSMLKIHAPFVAAGVEMEVDISVPLLPEKGGVGRREAELLLNKKMQEGSRLAYHKDIFFNKDKFEMCICGQEVLWINLYGIEKKIPGIALCHLRRGLAKALMADEFFIVLDAKNRDLFTIPYTIDEAHLLSAAQMGYPEEECDRLKYYYPKGQIFLSETSFRRGIENVGCRYEDSVKEACHHFQLTSGGQRFSFLPEIWEKRGSVLLIKKGRTSPITELADDMDMWSFLPGEKETAKKLIKEVCVKSQKTIWESVFAEAEWEGSIVISREEERIEFLILQIGAGKEVLVGII